jgi:demethylmenaquinone methyltransferase/2-methoxy-6-polyprenyl-1,4-benzoquinol methylase
MSTHDITGEMNRYYADRVPYHDRYMGYVGNAGMERFLAPLIGRLERHLAGKDVLEIACGTGNWTQVISKRACSVVATDLIEGYLEQARKKHLEKDNVVFRAADAYSLDGVKGKFSAAFAADWWSHMPHSRIESFIIALHGKLRPGANVVVLDMMRTPELDLWFSHIDGEGNTVQKRTLPNKRTYHVIKNFPTERELRERLGKRAVNFEYHEDLELRRWILTYSVP